MEKILKIISNGIFIGFILFVTVYMGIYCIAGNIAYEQEILNLTNIHIFTKHIVFCCIVGISIVILMEYIKFIGKKMKKNETEKDLKKSIKTVLLSCLSIIIITQLIVTVIYKISVSCSKTIGMMICINSIVGMCVFSLIVCTKAAIEELLINKKIKEKNKE